MDTPFVPSLIPPQNLDGQWFLPDFSSPEGFRGFDGYKAATPDPFCLSAVRCPIEIRLLVGLLFDTSFLWN